MIDSAHSFRQQKQFPLECSLSFNKNWCCLLQASVLTVLLREMLWTASYLLIQLIEKYSIYLRLKEMVSYELKIVD